MTQPITYRMTVKMGRNVRHVAVGLDRDDIRKQIEAANADAMPGNRAWLTSRTVQVAESRANGVITVKLGNGVAWTFTPEA